MNYKNQKINRIKLNLHYFCLFVVFSFIACSLAVKAAPPDAIAIRVMPNNGHQSAFNWYKNQAFQGSPQSILVDGYEAVRDGRTVYVNAANVSGNNLYTNIYLISYDQNAEKPTIDIFGRILEHWQFNSNMAEIGQCKKNQARNCFNNSDCLEGDYCLSPKAKIVRDVERLAGLEEIKAAIDNYRTEKGFSPKLSAGTYLPGKTLSVWPSWRQNLTQELGLSNLPADPINKIGDCGDSRFDPVTCWDEINKEFSGFIPSALPPESRVYAYEFIDDDNYTLCAKLETDYGNINSFDCL